MILIRTISTEFKAKHNVMGFTALAAISLLIRALLQFFVVITPDLDKFHMMYYCAEGEEEPF